MQKHVKILAVLFIVFGAVGLLKALVLVFGTGIATAIVGTSGTEHAVGLAGLIGALGWFFSILSFVLSLPLILAGIGLLYRKSWARILGIVASAVSLIAIPFGTILGVYGLWVLFSIE